MSTGEMWMEWFTNGSGFYFLYFDSKEFLQIKGSYYNNNCKCLFNSSNNVLFYKHNLYTLKAILKWLGRVYNRPWLVTVHNLFVYKTNWKPCKKIHSVIYSHR